MKSTDDMGYAPGAFLFANGSAAYFDEAGNQLVELNKLGLSGLHEFMKRFKDPSVVWAGGEHRAFERLMDYEIRELLKYIRTPEELK